MDSHAGVSDALIGSVPVGGLFGTEAHR